jgi:hypothetical protein
MVTHVLNSREVFVWLAKNLFALTTRRHNPLRRRALKEVNEAKQRNDAVIPSSAASAPAP